MQFEAADTLAPARRALLQQLSDARKTWRGATPHEYRLVASLECFCAPVTFESQVRDGVVVSGRGGVRGQRMRVVPELRTVESLFAEAERVIRGNLDLVTVVFDSRLAYPSHISVDRSRDASDDEWEWTAVVTPVE
jgi:hypothetical protein